MRRIQRVYPNALFAIVQFLHERNSWIIVTNYGWRDITPQECRRLVDAGARISLI